ncbi:MAG TPA: zinc dependent phospholipase C family protein, partial [Terriglobales bacterium]|nr:zinc dependent phospholipase C family protein [Terriglobales bacterium]
MLRRLASAVLVVVLVFGVLPPPARAYSVLSHEELIDMAWDGSIAPLLRTKFPKATPEEIKAAEAYAYGGCVIQDLGYYPFGSKFFSDLVHYVRSGDFVMALLHDAQNLNEYAFALGA